MKDSGVNGRIILKWFLNRKTSMVSSKTVQALDKKDRQMVVPVEINVRPLNKESYYT
jgi:hypothetical protein